MCAGSFKTNYQIKMALPVSAEILWINEMSKAIRMVCKHTTAITLDFCYTRSSVFTLYIINKEKRNIIASAAPWLMEITEKNQTALFALTYL